MEEEVHLQVRKLCSAIENSRQKSTKMIQLPRIANSLEYITINKRSDYLGYYCCVFVPIMSKNIFAFVRSIESQGPLFVVMQ